MADEQKDKLVDLPSAPGSHEDVYVEYMEKSPSKQNEALEDTYFVYDKESAKSKSKHEKERPKPRPRSKMRTKSYELAVVDSDDECSPTMENDYLPMDGTIPSSKNNGQAGRKPIPAPRPKDLDKRLAYARERIESPMFKVNSSPIMPTRKAPSPPAKPSQEIVNKYFPVKESTQIIVNEKVTVIQEETDTETGKERRISKIKERPRSSTWYDVPDEDAEEYQGELQKQIDETNATVTYEEIDEHEKPRPVSAYVESDVKLPTKKKHARSFLGGGLLDTLRSWTGSTRSVLRSPKENESPMRHSSKFYSDPEFIKSALHDESDVPNASPTAPLPRTPNLTLPVPVPSPRFSGSNSSEKSPTSPAPPIPPPRLSKSKGSFETGESFDDTPVFVNMPTSISSDTGLDIMARSPRKNRLESATIPEEFAPSKPSQEEPEPQRGNEPGIKCLHTPLLHPLSDSTRKSLKREVHKPIPEITHKEEQFDSLDVLIPPIQHQRVSPRKYPVAPTPLVITKKKKVPTATLR